MIAGGAVFIAGVALKCVAGSFFVLRHGCIGGMVGVIDKAILMGDDVIKRALQCGIGIIAEAFDETLD